MTPSPPLQIDSNHWVLIQGILRKHVPSYEVWAFGSRVRGTATRFSDLDLVILSDIPLSLDVIGRLKDAFSESDLPWKVDVIDWATTIQSFQEKIIQQKVIIYTPSPTLPKAEGDNG